MGVISKVMVEITSTKRTTLYRMLEGCTLETALTQARRESDDDFSVTDLLIEDRPARLVAGTITTRAKWATDLKLLTGQSVSLNNSSPGAALLIQEASDVIWAITWGTGFHFLDTEQIDFGFGSGIVARSALPTEVKSLTKTILDHRARVDRSSMPNGSTIRDLGVDGYGEVVSRIEAKAQIPNLAVGDKVIQLRAADSLNVPLAKSPAKLIEDLKVLEKLSHGAVISGLESLEQLVALKPQDSRVPALDQRLVDALKSGHAHRLGIAWPHERLDAYAPVMSVKVTGFGDRKRRVSELAPDIADVIDWFRAVPREAVLDRLKSVRVELHSEAEPQETSLSASAVPLRRWLAFEVEEGNRRFCLHDGRWYRMDDKYLARIDERVAEILEEPASLVLPPWGTESEEQYNKAAAQAVSGFSLDRKLISTPLHSRGGIEPCDVFVAPGVLVHVKRGRSSADLSHLLAQGLVSTDALARDENARAAWRKRITEESGGQVKDARIEEVVLAIGSERPVTVDTMFTFTKVNLVKQFDALRYLGVQVHVIRIEPPR
ncbi:DUF6119 family protein [Leifsonia sp. C5G2]|uniref:DUF6119 family protein n=1 Tax=Leifsonia sp. C5G2 TaxID=2735269 RepID=UPI001585205F|nr:DUF6119 family protein [Leifsonia sp. C5G2]NUU06773.1 TIGR04141 family sporadically distributed protein [Leifsonia sp. C5G2]